MKSKIIWLVVSCLMVLSLVLASCAPAAPKEEVTPVAPTAPTAPAAPITPAISTAPAVEMPQYGGVVNIVIEAIKSYGPVLTSTYASVASALTNERLYGGDWLKGPAGTNQISWVRANPELEFTTMWLAESYELVGDDTLIYRIRKGVHWALDPASEASRLVGGRELTAYDVAGSMNRWFFDPLGYLQSRLTPVERSVSIEATDKYTVVVKYQPGTISSLLQWTGQSINVFPPEVYDKYNKMRDWKHSVGTGPFMLKDVVEGSTVSLVKNPNYTWDKDPVGPGKGNQLPYLDGVKFLIIADKSTQLAALRTAKIDVANLRAAYAITWDVMEQLLKTSPELKYLGYITDRPGGLALRVDKPELPWYNKKVRQALTMAIDYDTIIRDYFKGKADFSFPIIPDREYMPYYTPLAEQNEVVRDMYTYQPEKAKKLLAEAGYPNGFKMEVLTKAIWVDELSIFKEYLAKVGVDLKIDVKESSVFTSIIVGAQQKEAVYEQLTTSAIWAFHPTQYADVTFNFARVNDPYANQVYADTRADYLFDAPKLYPMMKEFQKYVLEQAWYLQFPGSYTYFVW